MYITNFNLNGREPTVSALRTCSKPRCLREGFFGGRAECGKLHHGMVHFLLVQKSIAAYPCGADWRNPGFCFLILGRHVHFARHLDHISATGNQEMRERLSNLRMLDRSAEPIREISQK